MEWNGRKQQHPSGPTRKFWNFESLLCASVLSLSRYFHIYRQRLEALRERVAKTVRKELGSKANIRSLSDLDNIDPNEQIVVIGTLFKTQNLKPNILKEVGEENAITHEEVRTRTNLLSILSKLKGLSFKPFVKYIVALILRQSIEN